LILAGTANYSGGTTIAAGTLQIGNGGVSGSVSGDIANNGALIFNRSDNLSYSGSVTGTGTLTQLDQAG
jgi:fibronectin-binding autotransporter adhesin